MTDKIIVKIMFEEKFLIFGMFLAIWTISNCHGVAQDPNGAFLVHKILSQNENQNGINQNHLNEVRVLKSFFSLP